MEILCRLPQEVGRIDCIFMDQMGRFRLILHMRLYHAQLLKLPARQAQTTTWKQLQQQDPHHPPCCHRQCSSQDAPERTEIAPPFASNFQFGRKGKKTKENGKKSEATPFRRPLLRISDQLPYHPCKNGTHSTSSCNTRGTHRTHKPLDQSAAYILEACFKRKASVFGPNESCNKLPRCLATRQALFESLLVNNREDNPPKK